MATAKAKTREQPVESYKDASGPWADLVLTLPIFVGYHLGVIFLPVRNAADVVTRELVLLADNDMGSYIALTTGIGGAFVTVLALLGRGHALRWQRFAMIAIEGVVYAIAMRMAAVYVVGEVFLGPPAATAARAIDGPFAGAVMSLGAGFYEEIAFRVGLYGLGARLISIAFPVPIPFRQLLIRVGWAALAAGVFSGWHYVGSLGDAFDARSFVFRWVCGMIFTLIYAVRGFAPAVWTHTLYDMWVLVL